MNINSHPDTSYKQFLIFKQAIAEKKNPIMMGKDFVCMSRNAYDSLVLINKPELPPLIAEDFYDEIAKNLENDEFLRKNKNENN